MLERIENNLQYTLDRVGINHIPLRWKDTWSNWCEQWNSSMDCFPEDSAWLPDAAMLSRGNRILKLPGDALKAITDASEIIRRNSSLLRLAWHCKRLLFDAGNIPDIWEFPFPDPVLQGAMGGAAPLFSVVVLLSGLDRVLNFHRQKEIPADIIIDTFADFGMWINKYKAANGIWGLDNPHFFFFHFTGRLYRLGRLQFAINDFSDKIVVFRNRKTGKPAAMSEAGELFRRDGQLDGTNGIHDNEGSWTSVLEFSDTCGDLGSFAPHGKRLIRGNLLHPCGYAVKEPVKFDASEWEKVLSLGDPVIDIHIPRGGRLDHTLCGEALRTAVEFFQRYFPERTYKAYICNTWLFDPQFQKMLPASSNIVRFQREFYLYPEGGSDDSAIEMVFGGSLEDLSLAPRDTMLRRVILDHMEAGGHTYETGGFILKEDLNWGGKVYQDMGNADCHFDTGILHN